MPKSNLPEEAFENDSIADAIGGMTASGMAAKRAGVAIAGEAAKEEDKGDEDKQLAEEAGIKLDADGNEPKKEDDEGEDAGGEQPPGGDDKHDDDGEEDETTLLKKELEELRNANLNLLNFISDLPEGQGKPATAKVDEDKLAEQRQRITEEQAALAVSNEPIKLTDEEFEKITSDKEAFAKFLTDALAMNRQQALMDVGKITNGIISTRSRMAAFYKRPENKDLLPAMTLVNKIAANIQQQDPALTGKTEEAMQQAANKVRGMIGKRTTAATTSAADTKRGKFATPSGGARTTVTKPTKKNEDPNAVENQIAKMVSLGDIKSVI